MKLRKDRVRFKLKSVSKNSYRLVVFRSLKHVYVELFDPCGKYLYSSSSAKKTNPVYNKTRLEKAEWVGKDIAEKSKDILIGQKLYFDRGKYAYHGIIKKVAESARKEGMNF